MSAAFCTDAYIDIAPVRCRARHGPEAKPSSSDAPSTKAADLRTMHGMHTPYSGDPDVDVRLAAGLEAVVHGRAEPSRASVRRAEASILHSSLSEPLAIGRPARRYQ